MKKIIIFARVSSKTDRQDYQRQLSELKDFAARQGWETVHVIKAKTSASRTALHKRPDIQELKKVIPELRPDKVLVTEITRIGRKAKEIQFVIDFLEAHRVSLFIKNHNIETIEGDPMRQMVSNIVIAIVKEFAQMESNYLSERVKSGLVEAAKHGRLPGRPEGSKSAEEVLSKYRHVAKVLRKYKNASLREVAGMADVAPNTVRKVKKLLADKN